MWLAILSDQLPVVALVGHDPTNQLIGREPLPRHAPLPERFAAQAMQPRHPMRSYPAVGPAIPQHGAGRSRVTHPFASDAQGCPQTPLRLACVKHAASVRPEPGSNSPQSTIRKSSWLDFELPSRSRVTACPNHLNCSGLNSPRRPERAPDQRVRLAQPCLTRLSNSF